MTVQRLHFVLGILCAVPLFLWSSSGLLNALPRSVTTGTRYEPLQIERLRISPQQAVESARRLAGQDVLVSAMTLQQADGQLVWLLVVGGRSLSVDAESGVAAWPAPPGALSTYFTQAHYFAFAGPLRPLLLVGATAGLLALLATGLTLALRRWRRG